MIEKTEVKKIKSKLSFNCIKADTPPLAVGRSRSSDVSRNRNAANETFGGSRIFPSKFRGKPHPLCGGEVSFKLNEKTKKVLIILLAFLIFAFLLFNFRHLFIAAVVNNKPITRFALDRELEKQGGQQVLQSLITKSLILQEAKKQGVEISDEKVKEKISEIETQVESQGSDLDTLLQTQGQTRQALEEQIRIQLIVEEILGKEISITDEEIKNYFEENKESFGEDATFEGVKEQIREELRQTKLSKKFQPWLEELKQKAKIYYFLKF